MIYEGDVRDARSIARMINLAYRFECPPTAIQLDTAGGATRVRIAFDGAPVALGRLAAQIRRFVADELYA